MPNNGSLNGRYNNHEEDTINLFEEENDPDYKRYALTLWRNKWILIGCVILCTVLGYVASSLITPIYRSYGTLLVPRTGSGITISNKNALNNLLASTYGIGQGTTLGNQLFLLHSRSMANKIADTLLAIQTMPNGKQFPVLHPIYPDSLQVASEEVVTARLNSKLKATQTGINEEANAIKISYQSPSAVGAAKVVNLTLAVYHRTSMLQNRKSASSAVQFLKDERARIKHSLQKAEQNLQISVKIKG